MKKQFFLKSLLVIFACTYISNFLNCSDRYPEMHKNMNLLELMAYLKGNPKHGTIIKQEDVVQLIIGLIRKNEKLQSELSAKNTEFEKILSQKEVENVMTIEALIKKYKNATLILRGQNNLQTERIKKLRDTLAIQRSGQSST